MSVRRKDHDPIWAQLRHTFERPTKHQKLCHRDSSHLLRRSRFGRGSNSCLSIASESQGSSLQIVFLQRGKGASANAKQDCA